MNNLLFHLATYKPSVIEFYFDVNLDKKSRHLSFKQKVFPIFLSIWLFGPDHPAIHSSISIFDFDVEQICLYFNLSFPLENRFGSKYLIFLHIWTL